MKIAVICGGMSRERDVSISTGTNVARALRKRGHRVALMDLFLGDVSALEDAEHLFTSEEADEPYFVAEKEPDLDSVRAKRSDGGLLGPGVINVCQAADIAFLALHGAEGENGKLQACLDEVAPNANIRLRMGVMPWQKGLEPVQLVDRARTACKMARGHYQEPLIVYDEKVSNREGYEQRLVNDLRRALEDHEFEIFYQPKFDIQSEPAKLVSAEALVRWRHPELGLIPPFDFIPLFERNGQIGLLDRYVWAHAAEQIAAWKKKYGADISVSVNLSRVDVFDPDLVDTLEDILVRNDLDHSTVHLEVTESAYTENSDQVIRVVETLRDKGYKIEMDDFGTGYSSLNMLSDMPIDLLKMDRGFIRNIEHEEKDIQLVALILDIAKNLNVPVIAEGVETEEQIRLLKGLGCAMVQGYYFSKPLPADEFEKKYFIK